MNWENLGISNDFLFGLLQRILLDLKIDRIEYPELQKEIKPDADAKSIRQAIPKNFLKEANIIRV